MCMDCRACGPERDDYLPHQCSGCDCGLGNPENAAPDDSCGPCMRPGCPRCVGWALRNSKEVGNGPQ